jgi:N6-adenosine-specific RNA methylase IME4/ParB-like chromosome segregation protein Spo0J
LKYHPVAEIFPLMEGAEFDALVADIKANGLSEPILLLDGKILDGRNRWRACEKAKVKPRTVDYEGDNPQAKVISLNLARRHLSESQRAMVGARIATLPKHIHQSKADGSIDPSATVDQAAAKLNVSGPSVKRARTVLDSGTPELIAAVDRDEIPVSLASELARAPAAAQKRAVSGGHAVAKSMARKLKQERGEKGLTEKLGKLAATHAHALPDDQRYSVIYADPPWKYEHCEDKNRSIEANYPTMTLDKICALGVAAKIAADDAILFLWATSPKLAEAMRVITEWGFDYRTCAAWVKDKIGMGYYFRQRHELLLVATRGKMPAPAVAARHDSVVEAPRGRHSEKPEVFREIVERMYPGVPRIELFARIAPKGWDTWGKEA